MPRRPSATGLLRHRLRPASAGVRVEDERLVRDDGTVVAVVESGDLDVPALDETRRAAAVGAFSRLCRTLELPLQVVVQVRRWAPAPPAPAGVSERSLGPAADARLVDAPVVARLRAARDAHRDAVLAGRPTYRRRVLLVAAAPDGDAGRRALDGAVRSMLDGVAASGAGGRVLGGDALGALVAEAWGTPADAARPWTPARPRWEERPTHLRSGDVWYRGVVLRRLPGIPVEPGWLAPLLMVRTECDIALHLHPAPLHDAVAGLSRRLRDLRADQLVEVDRDLVGSALLEAGVDGALDLRARLARNEGRSLHISVTAVARTRALDELDRATEAVRLGFAAVLTGADTAHLRHHDAALTTWPLADDRSGARKLCDSTSAATCTPWVDAVCDDDGGYALGAALATDAPVRLDPFDTTRHANANIAVLAASGHGKSYVLGTLLLEAAARGVGAVVVDPEDEHGGLVRALGGEQVTLAPGRGTAVNIFETGDTGDGEEDRRAEVVGAVVDLAAVLCGGLDDVERAHLDAAACRAIDAARAAGRVAVLGDCLPALETVAPRVWVVLRRFCSGPLGELFNRPTSVRLDAAVVGVSLRDLRDELVPAATLVVAEWLWSLVRRDRRERHLVFDEVGLLCAHAPLRLLLGQLARRCRKYRSSLVVATQNAGDLLATDEGRVIATNPAIVMLGGHRGAETALMQRAYSLTDAQRRMLESATRGEFLLLAGSRRLAVRVETPPLHHALLTAGHPEA